MQQSSAPTRKEPQVVILSDIFYHGNVFLHGTVVCEDYDAKQDATEAWRSPNPQGNPCVAMSVLMLNYWAGRRCHCLASLCEARQQVVGQAVGLDSPARRRGLGMRGSRERWHSNKSHILPSIHNLTTPQRPNLVHLDTALGLAVRTKEPWMRSHPLTLR